MGGVFFSLFAGIAGCFLLRDMGEMCYNISEIRGKEGSVSRLPRRGRGAYEEHAGDELHESY